MWHRQEVFAGGTSGDGVLPRAECGRRDRGGRGGGVRSAHRRPAKKGTAASSHLYLPRVQLGEVLPLLRSARVTLSTARDYQRRTRPTRGLVSQA